MPTDWRGRLADTIAAYAARQDARRLLRAELNARRRYAKTRRHAERLAAARKEPAHGQPDQSR